MMKLQAPLALAARIMLALLFIIEGWTKIPNYAGTAAYMEHHGIPGALLPLVIVTELGGGLLVALGYQTRIAAFALAGFCALTALLFHGVLSDPNEFIQFYKDIAMAGGFLALAAFGAGEWSIDALITRSAGTGVSSSVQEHRG